MDTFNNRHTSDTLPTAEGARAEITEKDVLQWITDAVELGHGAQATVYKGGCLSDGKFVAVKQFQSKDRCKEESDVLCRLKHPNVIALYKSFQNLDCLVVEYMAGGSLQDRLDNSKGENPPKFTWMERLTATRDLVEGLMHLHEKKVYHRDIKPANLLFDENGTLKVSDMGVARQSSIMTFDKTETSRNLAGTDG